MLLTTDSGHLNILIVLDLTAAFDTVCHTLLLNWLETLLGITGTPLSWFKSYLTARQQFESISSFKSPTSPLSHGVPQGSVLGSLLFIIYILPLGHIIRRHGCNFLCYADDTQLYIHTKPSDTFGLCHCCSTDFIILFIECSVCTYSDRQVGRRGKWLPHTVHFTGN